MKAISDELSFFRFDSKSEYLRGPTGEFIARARCSLAQGGSRTGVQPHMLPLALIIWSH